MQEGQSAFLVINSFLDNRNAHLNSSPMRCRSRQDHRRGQTGAMRHSEIDLRGFNSPHIADPAERAVMSAVPADRIEPLRRLLDAREAEPADVAA